MQPRGLAYVLEQSDQRRRPRVLRMEPDPSRGWEADRASGV